LVFPNEERRTYIDGRITYQFKRNDLFEITKFLKEQEKNKKLLEVLEINIPPKTRVSEEFLNSIRKQTTKEIREWFNLKNEEFIKNLVYEIDGLRDLRNDLVSTLIIKLSQNKNLRDEFVFTFLKNEDFMDISNDDFSRLSEYQYRKFQSVRCYYNKLLKIVGSQSGVDKRITSHLSRHSYTSLMLELGENVNLFDLMTSLGHQHLSTTQSYIQKLSNKKMDKLNLVISDQLNQGYAPYLK
jgi:integrase